MHAAVDMQATLQHSGADLGFFGAPPAAQPTGFAPVTYTAGNDPQLNTTVQQTVERLNELIIGLDQLGLIKKIEP